MLPINTPSKIALIRKYTMNKCIVQTEWDNQFMAIIHTYRIKYYSLSNN